MDKNELWKLYCQKEREFERAKGRRAIKTILFFATVFFLIGYFSERPTGFEIIEYLLGAVILAGFYVLVNIIIFGQLCSVSERENRILEDLKKKMNES